MTTYVPGYMKGKVKKSFYVDVKLAKSLAIRATEIGISQSRLLEHLIRSGLGIKANEAVLSVLRWAEATADWSIGYVNNEPAVGDDAGNWYLFPKGCSVHNRSSGEVWHIGGPTGDIWLVAPKADWTGDISDSREWTASGPGYVREIDSEGPDGPEFGEL